MPDMDRQIKNRIEAFIRDISELAQKAVESKLAKAAKGSAVKARAAKATKKTSAKKLTA